MNEGVKPGFSWGSALLLAIVIISVLTTTTLGTVALTYEQLSATDRTNNSSVAKLAADSALARLREKIAAGDTTYPEAFNLSRNQSVGVSGSLSTFRPTPRETVYSLEATVLDLPRCLAVGVIAPWVNDGQYLFEDEAVANPALIFHYANIVNDTPLGIIAASTSTNSDNNLDASLKALPISTYSKLGHFYNPYAPLDKNTSQASYWTIRMGGPSDQFLTKKSTDGTSSFYRNLDFVYLPYLPRFTDSGLVDLAGGGLTRKTATELRTQLEDVIKANNFHVWLDGSVSDDLLYKYGLGDLFTNGDAAVDANEAKYQLTWIQPSLWNDLPEADSATGYASDLSGPYVAANFTNRIDNNDEPVWVKPTKPVKTLGAADGGWDAEILRGSQSFAFVYPSGDLSRTLTPSSSINLNFYGSYEGLRLNQKISLVAIGKNQQALSLENRQSPYQGEFHNASLTAINTANNSLALSFSSSSTDTPDKIGGQPVSLSDLSVLYLKTDVQLATQSSASNVTLQTDGQTISYSSTCPNSPGSYVVCPAVADIVGLNKAGQKPVWGRVTQVMFNQGSPDTMTGFKLDKFREYPKPLKDIAHIDFTDPTDSQEKIAYFGGSIVANEYDGSVNSVSDELWFYDPNDPANPSDDSWEYLSSSGPGARSGAAITYNQQGAAKSLVSFGGYRHEAVGNLNIAGSPACGDNYYLKDCLYANRPGARVAKIMPNDTWQFDLTTRTWVEILTPANDGTPAIPDDLSLMLRTISRIDERSGKDSWSEYPRIYQVGALSLNVSAGATNNLDISPSIAGLAIGDELSLTGQISGGGSFSGRARLTAIQDTDTVQVRIYGVKATGPVSLDSLSIKVLHRARINTKCHWSSGDSGCYMTSVDGLAIGDAVMVERVNNVNNPTAMAAVYSGYVSRIIPYSGSYMAYFISDEQLAGFDDFQSGTCDYSQPPPNGCQGESIRLRPHGRSGAGWQSLGADQTAYLWQGNQTTDLNSSRLSDTWEFNFASSRWNFVTPSLEEPPYSGDLTLSVVNMPASAEVFTTNQSTVTNQDDETCNASDGIKTVTRQEGVNIALVKDKWEQRTRIEKISGQPTEVTDCILTWDNSKTWKLEIESEGNTFWNRDRVVKDAMIVVERSVTFLDSSNRPQVERQSFRGKITSLDFPGTNANPGTNLIINVQHTEGDYEGLVGDSANAVIRLSYPNLVGGNGLTVTDMEYITDKRIQGTNISALSQFPVGTILAVYSTSQSFTAGGSSNKLMIAEVDRREPIITGGNVSSIYLESADIRKIINSPRPITDGINVLAQPPGKNIVFHLGDFRISKNNNWLSEWTNDLSNSTWQAQFGNRDANNNRPTPRSGGAATPSRDNHDLYLAGGTTGPYATIWKLKNMGETNGAAWSRVYASGQAGQDLPNLKGGSLELLSNDVAVFFGGERDLDSRSPVGPKVLGRPYNNTNNDYSFTLADQDSSLTAAQFVDLTYDQNPNPGLPNGRNSFQLRTNATNVTMSSGDNNSICQFVGETICLQQTIRHLGTLGRYQQARGSSLAIFNPGSAYKFSGGSAPANRSLILGAPAVSADSTNERWDAEGYYPYSCDNGADGCQATPFGKLSSATEQATQNSKSMMLAGFTKLASSDFPSQCAGTTACGSILVTAAGVGQAIATGSAGSSYCASYTVSGSTYSCTKNEPDSQYLAHIPDAEDLVLMFNAAKVLSGTDTYKVTGYYGGVRRGYLVTERASLATGSQLDVREIAP